MVQLLHTDFSPFFTGVSIRTHWADLTLERMNESMDDVAVDPTEEEPFLAVAVTFGGEPECDHKGKYRLSGSLYCAIRYCIECGKSWRTFIKPEYNDVPLAEWEEIKEHMEVPPLPASFYDDPQPFVDDDDDSEDDEERPI